MIVSIKRFGLSVISVVSLLTAPAAMAGGHKGEKTVGITAGYNTFNQNAVAGLFMQYRVNGLLRVAPDVTYIFKHHDTDGLAINLNVHMPLSIVPSGKFNLYPLAGLNYTSWSYHAKGAAPSIIETDDVSQRVSKFGFNIGAGIDLYATDNLKLFVEGKYVGVKHYSSGVISVGIGYRF